MKLIKLVSQLAEVGENEVNFDSYIILDSLKRNVCGRFICQACIRAHWGEKK